MKLLNAAFFLKDRMNHFNVSLYLLIFLKCRKDNSSKIAPGLDSSDIDRYYGIFVPVIGLEIFKLYKSL